MAGKRNNSRERIVPPGQSKVAHKIDAIMERASAALAERRYFDCEKLASDALRRAIATQDYNRVARITLPLQESRRQIRDLAVDTGNLVHVEGEAPAGPAIKPGMYLFSPPRVGVEGRLLREAAMQQQVPVVIVVREPATHAGLWPIVAVGPVTVRARIAPPPHSPPHSSPHSPSAAKPNTASGRGKARAASGSTGKKGKGKDKSGTGIGHAVDAQWMLLAGEALGDAAIAGLAPDLPAGARVLALAERLEAVPDHEKLHQRLEEAAREAAKLPVKRGSPAQRAAAALVELED